MTDNGFSSYVAGKLKRLSLDTSESRGALAQLVRAAGKRPEDSSPEVWAVTLGDMPTDLVGFSNVSYVENAVHATLSIYAKHKQGNTGNMHSSDKASVGKALASLAKRNRDSVDPVIRRFNILATAQNFDELLLRLVSVVPMLGKEGITLDYVKLAQEMYFMQYEERRTKIVFNWGRDFYSELGKYTNTKETD